MEIAIIGGGNMGGAIARALTQSSIIKKVKVLPFVDPWESLCGWSHGTLYPKSE